MQNGPGASGGKAQGVSDNLRYRNEYPMSKKFTMEPNYHNASKTLSLEDGLPSSLMEIFKIEVLLSRAPSFTFGRPGSLLKK